MTPDLDTYRAAYVLIEQHGEDAAMRADALLDQGDMDLRSDGEASDQRDLLLPKLVSGKIDVSEIGEQMAEAAAE